MLTDRCCSRTKNAERGLANYAYQLGLSAHLAAGIVNDWVSNLHDHNSRFGLSFRRSEAFI